MGKTRNLRRSKKVVKTKPKRTRSCVSKKNGKKTHKKRYSSRKKRGGLNKKTHSAEVFARLNEKGFFIRGDDDYNKRLLDQVSEDKTVIYATDPDSAIIHAANKIANKKANEKANENASLHITNFPNNPPESTIDDTNTDLL
tara:strand:- start:423 stop:848 length:426 start_codon:yes stop_codon:yes gene_type:complete